MLKKEFRVTKERDFQKVYKRGLFGNGNFIKVNALSNRRDFSRVAVVVSKKIEKGAVKRNKVKRITREAVRGIYSTLEKGYDIILNIKKEALGKQIDDIGEDLSQTLKKINLLK